MKNTLYIVLIIFLIISCNGRKITLNAKLDIQEKPKLSNLSLEFKGNDTLFYNNDHFSFFCMNPTRDSIEFYNKKKINSILKNNLFFENVFVENEKGVFRRINNFYPLKSDLQSNGKIHCIGLKKIILNENKTFIDRILIDPNFLRARVSDKKIRLHFFYKDSLNKSHIISNWILLK